MSKTKSEYPEIDHIRDDLESLKTNVVELTKHVQQNGTQMSQELAQVARKQLSQLQTRGKKEFHKVEDRIKAKPAQSLAIAFAVGIAASYLLGRKR